MGTNSVDVAALVASANSGDTFCIADLDVPSNTRRVLVSMQSSPTGPRPRITGTLNTGAQQIGTLLRNPVSQTLGFVEFTLRGPAERTPLAAASFCLEVEDAAVGFGGASVQRLPSRPVSSVNGRPIGPLDVSVLFLESSKTQTRVISRLPEALERAAVFGGAIERALLLLALPLLVLLIYVVVRVLASADALRIVTLALLAAAVSFSYATLWTVLLHPFHGPDESEHFAYAQHLAATNELPDRAVTSVRPSYSASELRLMEAVHHNSTILNTSSRLRWQRDWARRYARASRGANDADGGGYTASATGHSPLYYAYVGVPYRALNSHTSLPNVLFAMRLWSALLASVVAACTVFLARLTFGPDHNRVAWVSGVLVGLQPVFGSVSASVNNDTAVNAAAAVFLVASLDAWRRSPTSANAVVTGLSAIALPIAKVTGFALLPILPIAVIAIALRHGGLRAARWAMVVALSIALAASLWSFVAAPVIAGASGDIYNVHPVPAAPPTTVSQRDSAPTQIDQLWLRLRYAEQTFVPFVRVGEPLWDLPGSGLPTWPAYYIYIQRGYGLFGWRSTEVGDGLLRLVFVGLVGGWFLAAAAALRHRKRWRAQVLCFAFLLSAITSVLAFISVAYTTDTLHADAGEQGRYLFTALPALAVVFSSGVLALKGQWRTLLTGAYVGAAGILATLAWVSALSEGGLYNIQCVPRGGSRALPSEFACSLNTAAAEPLGRPGLKH